MRKNFFPRLTKTIFEVWKKPNPVLKSDFGYLFSNQRYSKKRNFYFSSTIGIFCWSCDFCFQSLSNIKLSITEIWKKTIIEEKFKRKPLVKSDLNCDLSKRCYSQKTETNQVKITEPLLNIKKHHRGSTRINPIVQNCFSTSNTT